ncbi:MAG: hypothetical protein ABIG46_01830, partial [Candidatus Omnitrophota bacterium]
EKSEEEVRNLTIRYLIEHNLLESHIKFLQNNNIGLVAHKDWLESKEDFIFRLGEEELIDNFEANSLPTDTLVTASLPTAKRVIKECFSDYTARIIAFWYLVGISKRLRAQKILPCSTIEYGVILATKVIVISRRYTISSQDEEVSLYGKFMDNLETLAVELHKKSINPYRTLLAALDYLVEQYSWNLPGFEDFNFKRMLELASFIPVLQEMHRNVLTDALGSEDMAVIFQDWSRKAEELQQEINYAIEFNNRLKAGILRLPIGLTERGAPIEVSDTSKSGVSLAIKQKFADVGSSQDTCYGGTSVDITNDGMIVRYYELNHDDMPPSRMNQREFTFPEPQDITDVAWDQTYSLRLVVTVNKNIPQTLLRGTKHFLKIIVLPPNDELEPYPATMPTTDKQDTLPAPDRVVSVPEQLAGFTTTVNLDKVVVNRDSYELKKPEALAQLEGRYQDRLRQIIGFVSHYITAPPFDALSLAQGKPLEVNVVIEPVQTNQPSIWYDSSANTLHIQVILLTDLIPVEYTYFVAHHDFIIHAYQQILKEKEAITASMEFLSENSDINDIVTSVFASKTIPIEPVKAFIMVQPEANIYKSTTSNMFAPDEHNEVNIIIKEARRERRGSIIQKGKTKIARGWREGKESDETKLERAFESLLVEHIGKVGKVSLPEGLGEFGFADELDVYNIVLIQPRNRSPGLIVKDRNSFQVAHAGVFYNTIYVDKITFDQLNIQELVALFVHVIIEIKAKQLVLDKGIDWTVELATNVHHAALEYEIKVIGESLGGIGSRLDDKINEILQSSFGFRIQSLVQPHINQLQSLIDRYHQMTLKEAEEIIKAEIETIREKINTSSNNLDKLQSDLESLNNIYQQGKEADKINKAREIAGIEKEINKIIDKINVFSKYPEGEIGLAEDVMVLGEFLKTKDADGYIERAKDIIINGRYTPEFFFAGAATRLIGDLRGIGVQISEEEEYKYRMYGLDIWDFSGPARENSLDLNLGMGPRQLFAYRVFLENLAREKGLGPQEVIRKQFLILHINEDIVDRVIKNFLYNNLFDFDPQKVLFIIQENLAGYLLRDGRVVFAKESDELPFGHGYATMQLSVPSVAFNVRKRSRGVYREYLSEDILTELQSRGAGYFIGTHRVNDLTKFLVEEVVNIQKLALCIYLIEQNNDIIVELVENPADTKGNRQKGGNLVQYQKTGKSFLIETPNARGSSKLDQFLNRASEEGAPYNAFRLLYRRESLKALLEEGLPYNLRFKEGYLYLEAVTGDITQLEQAKVRAFKKEDEVIKDFKQMGNLGLAIPVLTESDKVLAESVNKLRYLQILSEKKTADLTSKLRRKGIPDDFINSVILSMSLEHTSAETVSAVRLQDQLAELYDLMTAYINNPNQVRVSVKNPKDIYYKGIPRKQIPQLIDYTEIMIVAK